MGIIITSRLYRKGHLKPSDHEEKSMVHAEGGEIRVI